MTLAKVADIRPSLRKRIDAWSNALTGMGDVLRDKLQHTRFEANSNLESEELDNLYCDDDMAATIVDHIVDESFRTGYKIAFPGEEPKAALEYEKQLIDRAYELNLDASLELAWRWGRLQGQGACYAIVDDGQAQDKPLDMDRVREVLGFIVFERDELRVEKRYDLLGPKFDKPELYKFIRISEHGTKIQTNLFIHETRLFVFEGIQAPKRRRSELGGAGVSVLNRAHEALKGFQSGWQSLNHLLTDASQGVYKLQGLVEMIANGEVDTLEERMRVVDMARSVARSLIIDAETESFERTPHNLGGLGEIMDKVAIRLAAAAHMPVLKMMGQTPGGLGATGDNNMRAYYDDVEAARKAILRPKLEKAYALLMCEEESPFEEIEPDAWEIRFNSLTQLTDQETALLKKTTAETDVMYINAQVLLPEEVAINRFRHDGFSTETSIEHEERIQMLKTSLETMTEEPQEEPVDPNTDPNADPNAPPPKEDPKADPDVDENPTPPPAAKSKASKKPAAKKR